MNILLGITGSIAAYKAAFLTRLFVKEGWQVKVIMTPDATQFITPLTLSTLSKNPVYSAFTGADGAWVDHVALSNWADVMVVAPATSNTLAKMATGQCDNLLLACYLSATCPIYLAPAMDRDMYLHSATQQNLHHLQERTQHHLIPPGTGELASGLTGTGRMAEPEDILSEVKKKSSLKHSRA